MARFSKFKAPTHYNQALQVNRYRDASLVLRASGEYVPKRSEFGYGWGVGLVGSTAIEGAADRLEDLATSHTVNIITAQRALGLSIALMNAVERN